VKFKQQPSPTIKNKRYMFNIVQLAAIIKIKKYFKKGWQEGRDVVDR